MHRINPRCKLILNNQEVDGHIERLESVYGHDTSYRIGSRIPEIHYRASELKVSMIIYDCVDIPLMYGDIKCKLSNDITYDIYAVHIETRHEREGIHTTIDANLIEEENSPVQSLPVETQHVTIGYETPVSDSVYGHTWNTLAGRVPIMDFAEGSHKPKKVKEENLDDVDNIINNLKLIVEPQIK